MNYKVPGTDIVLEKDTQVFISVWGMHMDEANYPNPEKFDPERFNDENKCKIPQYAYLPFGEGPRICIGMFRKQVRNVIKYMYLKLKF